MTLTTQQKLAIEAEGNVLVVAGAGAGKTGTLVQRCIRLLLDQEKPVDIGRILVVTFTEAAAAGSVVGDPFERATAVTGGTAPFTWTIAAGTLPDGLELAVTTGRISGTATTPGTVTE